MSGKLSEAGDIDSGYTKHAYDALHDYAAALRRRVEYARPVMDMLLLAGEPEGIGKAGAAKLRAIIDGLIEQRRRAERAEAEAARLRETLNSAADQPDIQQAVMDRIGAVSQEAHESALATARSAALSHAEKICRDTAKGQEYGADGEMFQGEDDEGALLCARAIARERDLT